MKSTSGKKRKMSTSGSSTVDTISRGTPSASSSNIVVSFHEDQTSSIQYVTGGDSQPTLPINTNSLIGPSADYQVGGTQAVFHSESLPANDQIQIFSSPREGLDASVENDSSGNDKTRGYFDSFLVHKQQALARIPRFSGPDIRLSNEVDDELSSRTDGQDEPARNKKRASTRRPTKSQDSLQRQSEKDANLRSFDLIYENSDKIKLPNASWGYHKNDKDNNIMVFSKVRWFSTSACSLPLYERQVVLHESGEPKIYINNAFSPLETRRPRDLGELEQVLRRVDELRLCPGGPCIEFAESGALAQKDHAVGRWRHKCCPIVVQGRGEAGAGGCHYCASVNQVFRYPKQPRPPFGRRPRAPRQQPQPPKD